MESTKHKLTLYTLVFPVGFLFLMWGVYWLEELGGYSFKDWGILPGSISGLRGIITGPFIHGNFNHLLNNSVPMLFLGLGLFYFYREMALKVLVLIMFLGGFWLWISGRENYHIGASGVIYGLFSFLLISGLLRREKKVMGLSLMVAFLYGSMIWGIFPIDYKVSWEGHFWGLIAGVILAFYYRREGPQRKKFEWEHPDYQDKDELPWRLEDQEKQESKNTSGLVIRYFYKETKDEKAGGAKD